MNSIKLIATDMDDTLLTTQKRVPDGFVTLVRLLKQRDIVTTIASGRPLYTLQAMFPNASLGLICDNGGIVYYDGKVIAQSLLPAIAYHRMIDFVLTKTTGIPIVCGLTSAYIPEKAANYRNYLTYFYTNIGAVPKFEYLDVAADKFTIYFPNRDSRRAYDEIFRDEFSADYTVQVSGDEWIDIMNPGVDKGRAIKALGKVLDIKPTQMMAFGDAENDIPLLQAVKYSYIVANAVPGMAAHARFQTDSNDDRGVLKVMAKVLADLEADNE